MVQFKKVFTGLLLTAAAGMLLASCAGEENDKVKVSVWSNNASSKAVMTELVEEYNKGEGAQKGIEIDYIVHGADYETTLSMAIANGQTPDIYKGAKLLIDSVESNEIYPLNKLPNMEEFLDGYGKDLRLRTHIVNGETYVVPSGRSVYGLAYNKDMFKEAGIVNENGEAKPPETWVEMAEYAKRLTNPAKKQYGLILPLKWDGFWSAGLASAMQRTCGRGAYDRVNDEYNFDVHRDGLECLMQMKADGSVFPGAEGMDNDMARAQFAEGRVGMIFAASWDVGVYNDQFPAKCDWGVAQVPVADLSAPKYYAACSDGVSLMVSREGAEAHPEEIAEVFKFLNSEKVNRKMYANGLSIPYGVNKMGDVTFAENLKGWSDFGKIAAESKPYPSWITLKLEGTTMNSAYDKVWAGEWSVDEAFAELHKVYNESYEKSKTLYAEDLEVCRSIDPDEFDMSVKE